MILTNRSRAMEGYLRDINDARELSGVKNEF